MHFQCGESFGGALFKTEGTCCYKSKDQPFSIQSFRRRELNMNPTGKSFWYPHTSATHAQMKACAINYAHARRHVHTDACHTCSTTYTQAGIKSHTHAHIDSQICDDVEKLHEKLRAEKDARKKPEQHILAPASLASH